MSERFSLPVMKNAVVREAAVDEAMVPQDSVELALNVQFDRIGAVTLRPGTTLLGAQITAGTPVLGMSFYRNNAGSSYAALAKVGTTVKAYAGTSWSSVRTGLTAGSKARFTNFVDCSIMVNGSANEAVASWAGTGTFSTSTNVTNAPKGDYIENYRSRVWIADGATDKLYYSDVVSTTNTLTWPVSPQFLQISPQDGEKIRGIKRHPRALLVFKENHIYRIFSINSTDPDPSINRGTYSQESIIEAKDGIYYHHPTGFYKFVFDGEQEEISRPIIDIIQAIPRSSYENIAGWADDDHVYWSVGDVTVGGLTLSNLICRRTISTQLWTLYSGPTEIRSSALYDSGTSLVQLLGDTDGNVLQFDTGTTDNGSPIFYDIQTHFTYLTQNKHLKKSLTKLAALSENATGAHISFQIDTDKPNVWRSAGEIQKVIYDTLSVSTQNFTRIRFRISGSSSGTAFIFRGLEILDLVTSSQD